MTDLYLFLSGSAWVVTGMALFAWFDPEGEHDDLVMGDDYSIVQFGIAAVLWPLALLAMWLRKGR